MARLLLVAFEPAEALGCAGFAEKLGLPYDVLYVTGEPAQAGGGKALVAGLPECLSADALAKGLAEIGKGYTHIAALSSMRGKDVMARVAGVLDAAMVTDVIDLLSPKEFKRPIVAGTVIATVEALTEPVVLTVRPAGFPKPPPATANFREAVGLAVSGGSERISSSGKSGSRPDLTQAKVVVTGGRPLRDAETFEKVVGGLADALGGAVGATRAAVDSGIAANDLQVGQTGKIVAPDLYIAAGVSGSTQHMAGIKDSKIIVAVNKDPDAPIFEAADYGLVADLFDALPEMEVKIRGHSGV